MPHFPLFIDLKDKNVLVVGGGAVASRKIQKLLPFGPRIRVVAPEISPEVRSVPGLDITERKFRMWDLWPRPELVLCAANDPVLNKKIAGICKKRHIPVNSADDGANCSFFFPALVQKGSFTAGISTSGASPTAAAYFRQELEATVPENIDEILSFLEKKRPELKASIPDQQTRAAAFRALFFACMEKGGPLDGDEPLAPETGRVDLVGAGCGKADLITLRGLRLLQQCQAVVYDDLIDAKLLDAVPESALRIYMGKRSGAHSASQREINEKLIELARSGLRVVRLKGGDPYLFGRGGEEMLALLDAGVPCAEVPGISSAIGIPAEAGIPVTHRGMSRGLHIVTAHTSDTPDGLPADLDVLAQLEGTLVFLMGLSQLQKIASRLIAAGKDPSTPAAVISGGNAPEPKQVRAPLSQLPQAAQEAGATAPAIILVGEVAQLRLE